MIGEAFSYLQGIPQRASTFLWSQAFLELPDLALLQGLVRSMASVSLNSYSDRSLLAFEANSFGVTRYIGHSSATGIVRVRDRPTC